jgi:hypothetical protein
MSWPYSAFVNDEMINELRQPLKIGQFYIFTSNDLVIMKLDIDLINILKT